ncbi:snaclec A11-like [Patiria miniata]|uniref:C-type lectin domain-containing protein n=1 Tax=Patiria miniata TaxID=46514 RepID=A0A913Z6E3_PATMI|nr:snaclec A11-like [Patiria miniata]
MPLLQSLAGRSGQDLPTQRRDEQRACAHHVIVTACPQGWYQWHNSCYIALQGKPRWADAVTACQRPRSSLIVPNSWEEHNFIIKLHDDLFSGFRRFTPLWIGCDVDDGNQRCVGGKPHTNVTNEYTNCGNNHTSAASPDRCCLAIRGNVHGTLIKRNCNQRKFVMCEMPHFVPSYCVSLGADGRVARRCLHGHEIKKLTVQGVLECGQACWAERRCRSFNLWQGGLVKTCQLNNATRNEVSASYPIENGNCFYFDL